MLYKKSIIIFIIAIIIINRGESLWGRENFKGENKGDKTYVYVGRPMQDFIMYSCAPVLIHYVNYMYVYLTTRRHRFS